MSGDQFGTTCLPGGCVVCDGVIVYGFSCIEEEKRKLNWSLKNGIYPSGNKLEGPLTLEEVLDLMVDDELETVQGDSHYSGSGMKVGELCQEGVCVVCDGWDNVGLKCKKELSENAPFWDNKPEKKKKKSVFQDEN